MDFPNLFDPTQMDALDANYRQRQAASQQSQQTATPAAHKRNAVLTLLPAATSILGAVGGSFVAPLAGTAAGGAAGGALGEWLAQKLSGENTNIGRIAGEGALGTLGGVGKGVQAIRGASTALRAGEGAGAAVNALRFGAPAAEKTAATAGGSQAANWLSKTLLKGADDTALRASQLSGKKEALKNFDKRFGEDLGTYLRKNNLIGKTGKDVESSVITPLNKKYGDLVGGINRDITSSDILAQNQKGLTKLLSSASSDNKTLADDVFKELDQIFAKEGGTISPTRLNEIKSEYQNLARNAYKLGNNSKASVNEKVAQYLKKTIQGVSGSDELAATGRELDKGYKAADLLASAEQNGRGTLSFGLTDLMAAAPGGVVAGLPGAAATVAAKRVINSPRTQSFVANKLANAGEALAGNATRAAGTVADQTAGKVAKDFIKAQTIPRSIQLLANGGGQPPATPDTTQQATTQAPNITDLMGATEQASPYPLQNMQADIMRDPKNAEKYANLYDLLNPQGSGAGNLNSTAAGVIADTETGLQSLNDLYNALGESNVNNPIIGPLRAKNPFDSGAQSLQQQIAATKQIVGKALEGGVLRKEDEVKYAKILPTLNDTDAVAKAKIQQLYSLISQRLQTYKAGIGTGSGGVDTNSLQSILTAQ